MSARRPILAGNWKMNLLRDDAERFGAALAAGLESLRAPEAESSSVLARVEVLLFPPATLFDALRSGLGDAGVGIGGQDIHPEASGAHTGDLSAAQLLDAGCTWTLAGHSERRKDHGESDDFVGRKARAASAAGLVPLVCVGETGEERAGGATFDVLRQQLAAVVDCVGLEGVTRPFELAYEPVWAIGTGDTASPAEAQAAHAFLREELRTRLGTERAEAIRILYGGSAKPENVAELFSGADIDGFLVGGASLDADKFLAMIATCAEADA